MLFITVMKSFFLNERIMKDEQSPIADGKIKLSTGMVYYTRQDKLERNSRKLLYTKDRGTN